MKLNLDDVPWDTLEHAYGSATDVPEQLSLLLSPDRTVYQEALGYFWGNIIHQGTVYEATSYVVPFLIALLESPGSSLQSGDNDAVVRNCQRIKLPCRTCGYG
jgi:hypothetical protein